MLSPTGTNQQQPHPRIPLSDNVLQRIFSTLGRKALIDVGSAFIL